MNTPAPPAPSLDQIRAQFPALSSSTAFLDNAGGSHLPRCVIDAMTRYMAESFVQLGGDYPESLAAAENVAGAHDMVKLLLNAHDAGEVVLAQSTTSLCHLLASCYERSPRPDRNEIVVCTAGHEANIGAWMKLAERGWVVREWRAERDCKSDTRGVAQGSWRILPHTLRALLSERTRLATFPHVSNILGEIVDAAEVAAMAHSVGAKVVCDGVAYVPHRAPDVARLGVDWYVYSTYKVYGPHAAALFGTREALAELEGPNHYFIPRDRVPYKFELGGVNHESCASINGLWEYLCFLAGEATLPARRDGTRARDRAIVERAFGVMERLELATQSMLIEWLRARRDIDIIGPTHADARRVPTVSFVVRGQSSRALATRANRDGLAIRYGHFYSKRLVESIGLEPDDGVVRVSLVHYSSPAEVTRLIEWLERALA
ncbi:MAG: aminotransferase class V-fold PLP-dependent enzyme [Phycisphaerales bacterium]|nr:aminotransferase class V-fold PLP-dependent enzyme [Phycisphaerales bacterium]